MKQSDPIPTLEEFLTCCQAECEFLVQEYGFELLDSPREYNEYSVRYRKGEFGVDIYGENYGENASCDLVRGKDWLYLGLLLPRTEGRVRKPKRRPGQLAQVHILADLLRHHASDFLRGDTDRFDAALAEWRRMTQPHPLTEERRLEREREQAVTVAGHANKRGDFAEVVRLLEPHTAALSPHQRRMLESARAHLEDPEALP